MRLSEIKGEDAIDVIANILDPLTVILSDKEVEKVIKTGKPKLLIAKTLLSRQKKAILEILAYMNNADPKTFNPSLIELPVMLVQLIEDVMENEELASLFQSQGQTMASVSSGTVTEATEETEAI